MDKKLTYFNGKELVTIEEGVNGIGNISLLEDGYIKVVDEDIETEKTIKTPYFEIEKKIGTANNKYYMKDFNF